MAVCGMRLIESYSDEDYNPFGEFKAHLVLK